MPVSQMFSNDNLYHCIRHPATCNRSLNLFQMFCIVLDCTMVCFCIVRDIGRILSLLICRLLPGVESCKKILLNLFIFEPILSERVLYNHPGPSVRPSVPPLVHPFSNISADCYETAR